MADIIVPEGSPVNGVQRYVRYVDNGDGTWSLKVSSTGGGGGGGTTIDRELVVSIYRAKNAFVGASVGDTITATQVIDVSAAPSTVSTIWRNQTTAADLGAAPSAADLELTGTTALTDAQLRASAVPIGAVTAAAPVYVAGTNNALSLDTAGNLRVSGGGTPYTEDAAAPADPVGPAGMLVRTDTLSAATVSADGDMIAARATAKGEQYVKDADLLARFVAQGSATLGQTGLLGQAAVATAAPTYVNGQTSPLSLDTAGNLRVTTSGGTKVNVGTSALAASLVLKNTAGKLHGVTGHNSKASVQYIQLHDAVAVPADGAVPVVFFPVNGASPFSLDYGTDGRAFANGIVICNSSTATTKTAGAADCWFDAQVS